MEDECYKEYKKHRKRISVKLPNDITLPFLAYGFFKPCQLAYSQIKGYVFNKPKKVALHNFIIDHVNGMPVLKHKIGDHEAEASLMEFKHGKEKTAYEIISLSRNKSIYKWEVINIGGERANVLLNAGSESFPVYGYNFESKKYDWRDDPIYENTLAYLDKNISRIMESNNDLNDPMNFIKFIEIQSLYRTLWSALDRFITFRYGDYQTWNVRKLSEEHFFKEALKDNYDALYKQELYGKSKDDDWNRKVYSAENLTSYELNPKKPTCSALYYYTMRNNVVHSGKMLSQEVDMVLNALLGLTEIFRYSIDAVSKKKC